MWAARPHLGSIFEKLLHRKTFCLPAARILQPNFYVAFMSCFTWNIASRETTRIRFGKAGAHPQLALGIAIAPETLYLITSFWFWRQLRFFRFSLRFLLQFHCAVQFASQCGLLAHTSAVFLKNCCTEKLLFRLRLVYCNPISMLLSCHVMFHVKHCS